MPTRQIGQLTSRISVIHLDILRRHLKVRHQKLLHVRMHALRHSTPSVVLFVATCIPLPLEPQDLDDAKRRHLPWLSPEQLGSGSDETCLSLEQLGSGSDETCLSLEQLGSGSDKAEEIPSRDCETRLAMEVALNRKLVRGEEDPTAEVLSAWGDSFAGMLEAYLDHLDGHCCWRGAAGRPADDPGRHQSCVVIGHVHRLQDDIDDTLLLIYNMKCKIDVIHEEDSGRWSHGLQKEFPKERVRKLKSSGLGSALVKSCTPDEEMLAYESRQSGQSWQSWNLWESWESPPKTVRPERRALIEDLKSRRKDKREGSGNDGRRCTIRW